jgi:hypothetical protein
MKQDKNTTKQGNSGGIGRDGGRRMKKEKMGEEEWEDRT